jgi:hypothetical protein
MKLQHSCPHFPIYVCVCVCVYIYIYRERERENGTNILPTRNDMLCDCLVRGCSYSDSGMYCVCLSEIYINIFYKLLLEYVAFTNLKLIRV